MHSNFVRRGPGSRAILLCLVAWAAMPYGAAQAGTAGTPAPGSTSIANARSASYYQRTYGIEDVQVKVTASGRLVRLTWRVVDPSKAAALSNRDTPAFLVDRRSSLALQVPEAEQIGRLRQTAPPEAGREYWMVFSNKGAFLRGGDRVDLVAGLLKIPDLVVLP